MCCILIFSLHLYNTIVDQVFNNSVSSSADISILFILVNCSVFANVTFVLLTSFTCFIANNISFSTFFKEKKIVKASRITTSVNASDRFNRLIDCHLYHCQKSVPYSRALHLNQICSMNNYFDILCNDLEKSLTERG